MMRASWLRCVTFHRTGAARTRRVSGRYWKPSFSENFKKIATWSEQRCTFSHFRDKDKNEVDIVLENRRGDVVGIKVKSSATVSTGDFSGMRKLAGACGERFVQGMVLYDHDQVVPFGENMFAAPLSCLWGGE